MMIWNVANKTIQNIWPMLAIFLVVLITTRIAYLFNHREKVCFYKEVGALLFIVYILMLFELVTSTEINSNGGVNFVPFTEIFRYAIGSKMFIFNVLGNILMFLPFGYFISYYINGKKVTPIFLITLITSTCIEFVQLKIGRSFDVDDILLNVVGSTLGFFFYVSLNAIKNHLPKLFQKDFIYNLLCLAIIVILVLYFFGYIKIGILK